MERIARDDEQALAELVAAVAPCLLRFVRRALGANSAEAEDVVQEVFVRIWKARYRWRPEAAVKTYVFTIASRLCLNRARDTRRAPLLQPLDWTEAAGPEASGEAADPERALLSGQMRSAVESEIAALPASQRAALLLRHGEELSYQEIAAALDTSAAAVESLLSRARARLRSRLASWMTEGKPQERG